MVSIALYALETWNTVMVISPWYLFFACLAGIYICWSLDNL